METVMIQKRKERTEEDEGISNNEGRRLGRGQMAASVRVVVLCVLAE
jgi:hypothetical protein